MQLEWATDTCPTTGIAAYALVIWMNLSTLAPFRNFSYEFFVVQHIITFIGFIVAVMLHIPSTALYARTYIYIAIGFYLFSRLVQSAFYAYRNANPSRATLTRVAGDVTMIRVAHRNLKSWTPGQFVLLGIPRYGPAQSHPATIASTPTSHGGDLVFFLRGHNGFTKRILHASEKSEEPHIALIDGPYGGTQSDFAAFHTVTLIAGSTGISFILPILLSLAARCSATKLPLQELNFIWAVKHQASQEWIRSELGAACEALRATGINVNVAIHVTGVYESSTNSSEKALGNGETDSTHSGTGGDAIVAAPKEAAATSTAIRPTISSSGSSTSGSLKGVSLSTTKPGRPDVGALLAVAKKGCVGEMGVAVCGPLGLSRDVRNAVTGVDGAVYLHVEGFAW
jgi:ferric-chelate reductase